MTHRILFLDLPGVLVVDGQVSLAAIETLNDLTAGTGADLVLIQSWPTEFTFPEILRALQFVGVKAPILGCTPRVPVFTPAGEIQMWLDQWRWAVAAFCVLSSDPQYVEEFGPLFIPCSDGLTVEIARQVAGVVG